jgi:hypothetical protein
MSDFQNVSVCQGGTTYVSGASAKAVDDAAKIDVWGGQSPNWLEKGVTYLLTGTGGLDTNGRFLGGAGSETDPWVFENVL